LRYRRRRAANFLPFVCRDYFCFVSDLGKRRNKLFGRMESGKKPTLMNESADLMEQIRTRTPLKTFFLQQSLLIRNSAQDSNSSSLSLFLTN
jgi:hypothetical protein